jgi:hypothetical protein
MRHLPATRASIPVGRRPSFPTGKTKPASRPSSTPGQNCRHFRLSYRWNCSFASEIRHCIFFPERPSRISGAPVSLDHSHCFPLRPKVLRAASYSQPVLPRPAVPWPPCICAINQADPYMLASGYEQLGRRPLQSSTLSTRLSSLL